MPLHLPHAHGPVVIGIDGTIIAFLPKNDFLGGLGNLPFLFLFHVLPPSFYWELMLLKSDKLAIVSGNACLIFKRFSALDFQQ